MTLTQLNPAMALNTDWHDLTRYEIPTGYPLPAKPLQTGKRFRAALRINNGSTVYSTRYFDSHAEAEQAAGNKIKELKG